MPKADGYRPCADSRSGPTPTGSRPGRAESAGQGGVAGEVFRGLDEGCLDAADLKLDSEINSEAASASQLGPSRCAGLARIMAVKSGCEHGEDAW